MKKALIVLFIVFAVATIVYGGFNIMGDSGFVRPMAGENIFENYQVSDGVGGWENYQVDDGASGWENYQVVQ